MPSFNFNNLFSITFFFESISSTCKILLISDKLLSNDLETIANQVHGIKSKLMMMGMNKTKDITDSIELQCRGEKETTTLLNDVERLIFQLNEGLSELKISLEKQKVQV